MIIRRIESGPFVELTAALELPALEQDGAKAMTRLSFAYRTGAVVSAVLEYTRRGDRAEGSIRVEWFGKDAQGKDSRLVLAGVPLPEGPIDGEWKVWHRHGLVRVERNGRRLLQADTGQRVADLGRAALIQPLGISRCNVSGPYRDGPYPQARRGRDEGVNATLSRVRPTGDRAPLRSCCGTWRGSTGEVPRPLR